MQTSLPSAARVLPLKGTARPFCQQCAGSSFTTSNAPGSAVDDRYKLYNSRYKWLNFFSCVLNSMKFAETSLRISLTPRKCLHVVQLEALLFSICWGNIYHWIPFCLNYYYAFYTACKLMDTLWSAGRIRLCAQYTHDLINILYRLVWKCVTYKTIVKYALSSVCLILSSFCFVYATLLFATELGIVEYIVICNRTWHCGIVTRYPDVIYKSRDVNFDFLSAPQ